ncbi:L-fucose isomerase [Enterocloster aldenensis]|nr:L-fucose isomerase [Enterocloster aldenensis]
MAVAHRYVGNFPVIGIRPVIDARQGAVNIRGGLEEQTMHMAMAAKKLFEENIRYINGEKVQVVIADSTIGRVAEAAACAEKFKTAGVDITLSVTPCWCYGSETMDMDPRTIKGVWGLNATERPGAVYLASVLASHARKGLPAFGIYGMHVQEADDGDIPQDVRIKLLAFARAAVAAATMRGKSYLQIGSACMGISGSFIDPDFFEEYLGMRVESVDEVEVIRRIEQKIYDEDEYGRAMAWVKGKCKEGIDKNPEAVRHTRDEKDENWKFTVKCALIMKDLMNGNNHLPKGSEEERQGHNALAAGFQGQRQWTDHYPNTDFAEAILNSSFDWDGPREPYILSTENDTLNGVSMMFLKLLTGRAQMFADVRTCWSAEAVKRVCGYDVEGKAREAGGFIHLINSGACCLDACGRVLDGTGKPVVKPWWDMEPKDVDACMDAVTWCEADLGYFRGGGYSSRFETREEMPMTMIRLNLVKGLGPVVQLVEGWSVKLPENVSDQLWRRTDYTWPSTWFTPKIMPGQTFSNVYEMMNRWGANHGAISYGHIGADVMTLCSMLRIPVCMHNVGPERIFRPAAWNAFGMDPESQDYRACKAYGPLYR